MKLVVGLGNPGSEYEETKHNVGFWVVDAFSARCKIAISSKACKSHIGQGADLLLAKPQTFMNRSGEAVRQIFTRFDLTLPDLILVYDDLDTDCGKVRIRTKGSAGGHRGVASVIEAVGSDCFLRMKIGIGRDPRFDSADYVLSPFSKTDKLLVDEAVERGCEALPLLIDGQVTIAMNRYHTV